MINIDRDEAIDDILKIKSAYGETKIVIDIIKNTTLRGISKEDAVTFDAFIGSPMLQGESNFGQFSSVRTPVGVNIAMESFFKAAGDVLLKASDFSLDLMVKLMGNIRKSLARKLVDATPTAEEVASVLAALPDDRELIISRLFNAKYTSPIANYIKSNLGAFGAETDYSDAVTKSASWIRDSAAASSKVATDIVKAIAAKDVQGILSIHDEFIKATDALIPEGQMTPEIPSLIKVEGIGLFDTAAVMTASSVDGSSTAFSHLARVATRDRYDFVVEAYTDDIGLDTTGVGEILKALPTRDAITKSVAKVDAEIESCERALEALAKTLVIEPDHRENATKLTGEFYELAEKFEGIRVRLISVSSVAVEILYMIKDISAFQTQVYSTTFAMRSYLESSSAFLK